MAHGGWLDESSVPILQGDEGEAGQVVGGTGDREGLRPVRRRPPV